MTPHKKLQNEILRAFGVRGDMRVWLNPRGVGLFGNRRVTFGVPGQADICGLLHTGRMVQIEIKVGPDKQSNDQKNFQAMIERMGGLYILARSVEDVRAAIEEAMKK